MCLDATLYAASCQHSHRSQPRVGKQAVTAQHSPRSLLKNQDTDSRFVLAVIYLNISNTYNPKKE
jgi:hypothetical protein